MNKRISVHLMAIMVGLQIGQMALAHELKVIGYSMNPASAIVREHASKHITDLVYFSVQPKADATVDMSGLAPEDLDAVRELIADRGIRVHLAVGGWGRSEHFAFACRSPESRATLIEGLMELCRTYGLSGIDYDWEFPASAAENVLFASLIVESKTAFNAEGLELSAALSPWQKFESNVYASLDRVHLMAYDFGKRHATLDDATRAVKGFLDQGVPAKKLFLGVPFYGRKIDDAETSITYRELLEQHALTREMDEIDGFYFNGPETIASKTRFAIEQHLGGVMIWELGQDVTDHRSLLNAIAVTLQQSE